MTNMEYFKVKKIYSWLYSIYDPQSVFCYLAVGNESALLFDTGFGIGSLPQVIGGITDKPLTVVLGHGHIDHACGAYQFNEVWLHEKDFDLCREHTAEDMRLRTLNGLTEKGSSLPDGFDPDVYVKAGTGNLKKLDTGTIFDLGGLHMEVIAMEGHTAGSIGLLAKEHKVLLDSDSANPHVWMFLNESLYMDQYISMLERVIQLDFDTFITGHSDEPLPKSWFNKFINAARNASAEKALPYNTFAELKGLIYKEDGVEVVFRESKLRR